MPDFLDSWNVSEGTFPTSWKRAIVKTTSKVDGNTVRAFVIEPIMPADGEGAITNGETLEVWGPFRIVEKVNNTAKAIEAWKAFKGAEEPAGK